MLVAATAARGDGQAGGTPAPGPDDPQAYPRFHAGRGGRIGRPSDRGRLTPGFHAPGQTPVPVEMPDLPWLQWKMVNGVKEYHLVAEVVRREFLPGEEFYVWGFNGTMPGPFIEAVQGDRGRFVVHNKLPEPTTVHFHGLELPVRYDGVEGITQEPIPPGKTFFYAFDLHQEGSYFYHSHGAMQEIMGMSGMFVIQPREAYEAGGRPRLRPDLPGVRHPAPGVHPEFGVDGLQLVHDQRPVRAVTRRPWWSGTAVACGSG